MDWPVPFLRDAYAVRVSMTRRGALARRSRLWAGGVDFGEPRSVGYNQRLSVFKEREFRSKAKKDCRGRLVMAIDSRESRNERTLFHILCRALHVVWKK